MRFWRNSQGCCCGGGEPDPCTDTPWDVQFRGCDNYDYTGGGGCELRRYSDDALLATATLGPTGYASGVVTLDPAPTSGAGTYEVTLHVFPDDPAMKPMVYPMNMICGSPHGFADEADIAYTATPALTIDSQDDYICCTSIDYRPIPRVVTVTDNAGTTTLTYGFSPSIGTGYVGEATMMVPVGRQTFGGCTAPVADITIRIEYLWSCVNGSLARYVSSCGGFSFDPDEPILRDKDDIEDITNANTILLTPQDPTTLSYFPVSATFAAFSERGADFGAASVVE